MTQADNLTTLVSVQLPNICQRELGGTGLENLGKYDWKSIQTVLIPKIMDALEVGDDVINEIEVAVRRTWVPRRKEYNNEMFGEIKLPSVKDYAGVK